MIDRTLLDIARPYRALLSVAGLVMLASSLATLALPWLGQQVASRVLADQTHDVGVLLLFVLALFAAQAAFSFGSNYLTAYVGENVGRDLRQRIFDHLQMLPLMFFQERRRGEVLALLTNDAVVLSNFISGTLPRIFPMLVTVAGALVLMLQLEPRLALVVAILVPSFYLILRLAVRTLRPLAEQIQGAEAKLVGVAEENLAVVPLIKAFSREESESARFANQSTVAFDLKLRAHTIYAGLGPLLQFLAATSVIVFLWLATASDVASGLTPAELIGFMLYAAVLTRPVSNLAMLYGQAQNARGALARLKAVLGEQGEPLTETGHLLDGVRGRITFENVSFAYPAGRPVLISANLEIAAGETVALTGANGAGKSTLVHLLMRLHAPEAGRILLDGIDISQANLRSLRDQIGLVPQNVWLLNASVAENIAVGKASATQLEIELAARAAQAHDFIMELPQGYDTIIGDAGVMLSGGQRQRLALARALLKDPQILILDEATAMFDLAGERALVDQIRDILKDRTVILITHRPASLALADRVVTVKAGRIEGLKGAA